MPIDWPFKPNTEANWKAMPYEQRMRRIRWFSLIHYDTLNKFYMNE